MAIRSRQNPTGCILENDLPQHYQLWGRKWKTVKKGRKQAETSQLWNNDYVNNVSKKYTVKNKGNNLKSQVNASRQLFPFRILYAWFILPEPNYYPLNQYSFCLHLSVLYLDFMPMKWSAYLSLSFQFELKLLYPPICKRSFRFTNWPTKQLHKCA